MTRATKQQQRFTESEVTSLQELWAMLATCRPAKSDTEVKFIDTYLMTLPGAYQDTYGNVIVRTSDTTRTLWSSHTDTVHRQEGVQKVHYDKATDTFHLPPDSNSSCLGADCTTGVWLMRQMIKSNVPGLYIFHREEEIGGKGSDHIAWSTPELLAGIDHAIAFDRKGSSSIITHQAFGCCASQEFANDLALLLPPGYATDDSGSFTDTANYTGLVPECTNLAVGYERQHTPHETQHIGAAINLLRYLLRINQAALDTLPVVRPLDDFTTQGQTISGISERERLAELVWRNPDTIADLLVQYGFSATELADYCGDEI